MSVSARIKELMVAKGLTIEAFAELLGEKPQRIKDVYREKQRAPESMLAAMTREGFDVGYALTGMTQVERARMDQVQIALKDSTQTAVGLNLPKRESGFVRDLLYGVALKNEALIQDTIESYVAERLAKKPRKKGAK